MSLFIEIEIHRRLNGSTFDAFSSITFISLNGKQQIVLLEFLSSSFPIHQNKDKFDFEVLFKFCELNSVNFFR